MPETLDFTRFLAVQGEFVTLNHVEPTLNHTKKVINVTAKEYLMQIKDLTDDIQTQKEYVQSLRELLDVAGVSYDKERVQTSPDVDKFGHIFGMIDEGYRELEELETKRINVTADIIQKIYKLDNENYRNVLNSLYVNMYTLKVTSEIMNFSYDYVKELHGEALKAFEQYVPTQNPPQTT